jgi:cell division protein ZapA (FtsZ GTPase activity inhibitor)
MRKTEIRVNNRPYQVMCDADQLDHVRQLADEVDARAREVAANTRHANETTVLLFTCLMLADELYEARLEAGELHEKTLRTQHDLSGVLSHSTPEANPHTINHLLSDASQTLEQIAKRLQRL